MNEVVAEEKMALVADYKNAELHETSKPRRKGGLLTMPFIIVNESFEKVASYGIMPNLIFYLMNEYHMEAANGSMILSLWNALSNFLAIFGAFLSDSYLGRFAVIALGTVSSLVGTSLLWSTSLFSWMRPPSCTNFGQDCDSATPLQLLVLFSSFGLISIGAGCVRPCSIAFGADQMDNKENPDNERVLDSFFNWYYASTGLSSIIALTVVVYIQDQLGWQIGFGVPALLMILSLAAFLLGSNLYVHVKPKDSLFISLIQVPVAAYQKRKITLPPPDAEELYFRGNSSKVSIPSDNLRCLNRACVVGEHDTLDGSTSISWSLCSVDQVETVKAIARLIPLSTTGIILLVAMSNNFISIQAKTMDRHLISGFEIPAGTFTVFTVVTITFWVAFYDRAVVPVLDKYFDKPRGLTPKVRMGVGLLLSCASMLVGGLVESIRRKVAISGGMVDRPDAVVDMSAMWLVPQLVLIGLGEAFNSVAQIEFFYTHLSKSMASLAMAIFTMEMAVSGLVSSLLIKVVDSISTTGGNISWLSKNLNQGHVDYYYYVLAILCLLNFLYFLICFRAYGGSEVDSKNVEDDSDYKDLPSA